jgi:hypothetical protein
LGRERITFQMEDTDGIHTGVTWGAKGKENAPTIFFLKE